MIADLITPKETVEIFNLNTRIFVVLVLTFRKVAAKICSEHYERETSTVDCQNAANTSWYFELKEAKTMSTKMHDMNGLGRKTKRSKKTSS